MILDEKKIIDDMIKEDPTSTISDFADLKSELLSIMSSSSDMCEKCRLPISQDCDICNWHTMPLL